MRTLRFYMASVSGEMTEFLLPEEVHRHAVQVLRLKSGARISLFDGQGQEFMVELIQVEKRQSSVRLIEPVAVDNESPLSITLLQGISRGERMDFAIQKAVELGVKRIVPVVTERCSVQLNGERAQKRLKHWQGIIISACEQSGRAWLPELSPVTDLPSLLEQHDDEMKLTLAPSSVQQFSTLQAAKSLSLLIGPEGGLSDQEEQLANNNGFTSVQFGPRILRTETAALAALSVVQTLWGDMG
ncbi:hypothetical protein LCGC14_0818690 [marine sediment metagenome]|uniref:16S rRNA (uracil(1498)-N(3))-methyltransferase n=1 Tax=marine sediment metagenome TaxID=412755 RepID=A0A0F9SS01_9ZZZZ|nr:16S rRNA (uracil(1498)-N(3))-methyltransferase [Methylophaga aminisulfidivorans]